MQKDYVPEHYEHERREYVPSLCDGCKWLGATDDNGVEGVEGVVEYSWQACVHPKVGDPHVFLSWLARGNWEYTRWIVTGCKHFEP